MMAKDEARPLISECNINVFQAGGVVMLDAVKTGDRVDMFFTHDTDPDLIRPAEGVEVIEAKTVGNAPWITVRWADKTPVPMRFGSVDVKVTPHAARPMHFDGRNVALTVRNGESADVVLDWIDYHAREQGLDGVLMLSRARPGTDRAFLRALRAGLGARGLEAVQVLLVDVDHPMGQRDRPAEAHPINVPESPGKDRMEIPDPAPWDAPLAEVLFYEWARRRYLTKARAVANIEVQDLIVPDDKGTVFDRAVAATSGYIQMLGRHCYPWRPKGDEAHFADHICVQFDAAKAKRRWCIVPEKLPDAAVMRLIRIGGAEPEPKEAHGFFRFMAIRHPSESISKIVPKTSLIEHPPLQSLMKAAFPKHKPVPMPVERVEHETNGRRAIITTMKNEGPFILEWIAYHRAIGFDDFLVYTNDCDDGTDELLDILMAKGIVEHRDNPFRESGLKPQHAALQDGEVLPIMKDAEWCICMDVDEYINIKCGDGTLDALFEHTGDVNMISCTWRLFGNGDVHEYRDGFIMEEFTRCAREFANKPHQAWGFKTLYKNIGLFKKMGVHRPKGLKPQLWDKVRWVNGSGKPLPKEMYRNAWRSTTDTYGYDLVQLNHYAVRSAESFLVKRDRGRVNHVDRDQGLAYWFRMNNNAVEETSILKRVPMAKAEFERLMADDEIRAAHNYAVERHRAKIDALKATENYSKFYEELTGERMESLARLHHHFGANVFLQGPESVPEEVWRQDPEAEWFFTCEAGETQH